MKVAVFKGVKNIKLEERPDLKAETGEVIVKVKYCGICGTDVQSYVEPGRRSPNTVLGHEVVGTVAEIGEEVIGWKLGDRVLIGPPGSCGECYYCRHGHFHICTHALARTIGLTPNADGGMAEYVKVRDPQNMLYSIPDTVSFEDAVLMDTIAVAFHGIRESHFRIGDNVVVSGSGSIGLSAIQFLKIGGAKHITVLEPHQKKREMALEFGADMDFDPVTEGPDLQEKILSIYVGIGADIAFECAGVPDSFQTVLKLIKRQGQVNLIGTTMQPSTVTHSQFVRNELELKGSFVYSADDICLCLDFLAQRRFNTKGMVSDIIALDDVVESGFERLIRPNDFIKIIIAP